ncbi:hypothetical protein MUG84_20015 [Paenibacillus sp. KQZ6P-2]|uniref:Uncharacterized protein n=1 Tax=Paenibacillus mangrovi TaxID=2931978 RepID=A0A9X1WS55_9BACL|nr:hypothetical protein [Paenibacillus mangrovi]MCJ8014018.1 hypothetical protein [Paenibacillus mangrovi]
MKKQLFATLLSLLLCVSVFASFAGATAAPAVANGSASRAKAPAGELRARPADVRIHGSNRQKNIGAHR